MLQHGRNRRYFKIRSSYMNHIMQWHSKKIITRSLFLCGLTLSLMHNPISAKVINTNDSLTANIGFMQNEILYNASNILKATRSSKNNITLTPLEKTITVFTLPQTKINNFDQKILQKGANNIYTQQILKR